MGLSHSNLDIQVAVVAGAAANTDIAVAGITTRDALKAVFEYDPDGRAAGTGQVFNRTGEAAITSDGNIQLTTTNTTGHDLMVIWISAGDLGGDLNQD